METNYYCPVCGGKEVILRDTEYFQSHYKCGNCGELFRYRKLNFDDLKEGIKDE